MQVNFPLYTELKNLKGDAIPADEQTALLAKIGWLGDPEQLEVIYAIMQAYVFETSTKSVKSAKERFKGTWMLLKPQKGVCFNVKNVPDELRNLLAKYILFITGDPRAH